MVGNSGSKRGEMERVMRSGAIPFPARDSKCPINRSSISSRVFVDLLFHPIKFESTHFRGGPVEWHLNRDPY